MRSIFVIVVAVILMAILFIACGETKKEESIILSGRVTEADTSIYLEGVTVRLKANRQLSDATDSAGYYQIDGVPHKKDYLYFDKEGYHPDSLEFEYTGDLERPIISRNVVLEKIGTDK